jgi:hypothetical protein
VTGIEPGAVVICVGQEQQFAAQGESVEGVAWSTDPPGYPAIGSGATFMTVWHVPGEKIVTASCSETSAQADVTVVAVDKVIIDGSEQDDGPATICYDESITLRAKPEPSDALFPESPMWEFVEKPDGSQLGNPPLPPGETADINPDQPGTYKIKASCGDSSATFTVHALKVTIGDVDTRGANLPHSIRNRGATINVQVTIVPEGVSVNFDVIGGTQASITANATRTTSGTIELTSADDQTGVELPLRIRARFNGTIWCGLSNPFAVCAHPVNYAEDGWIEREGGVLYFLYKWGSDSNEVGDLNQARIGEHATYPGGDPYDPPNPPFTGPDGGGWGVKNPTVRDWPAHGGVAYDEHLNAEMSAGPASTFSATQYYRFECLRCGAAPHNDHTRLMGPITITRFVEFVEGVGWRYRITKSVGTATRPLP